MEEDRHIDYKGGQGQVIEAETFRDSITTMDQSGKRKWVYPKKPKGKFTNYRHLVSILCLVILFSIPFIKVGGNPLLLFNIVNREFFIFGKSFYPQDFYILAIGAIASIVFVILFTAVFGRIFCGWICPQTIFMETVFRKIEFAIEGDRNKQIRLNSQPWNTEKILKKSLKWFVFAIVSLVITHLMFMYIVGPKETFVIISNGPMVNTASFIFMFVFTALFYFVFAWFREQVCTLVCPYGRLQGVLIDKQTINVYYDHKRGENRSTWRKGEDRKISEKGDCIDCNQCVVVCPTGIDIRNGQQLECINCTMCIDACDEVMEKIGFPKGLIRYATEDEIEKEGPFKFTNRMKAYTVLLCLLVGFLGFLLNNRGDMESKFIKPAGSTYFLRDAKIINTYNYTLLNKSNKNITVTFKVLNPKHGTVNFSDNGKIKLTRDNIVKGTINISFPADEIKLSKQNIDIAVCDENGKVLNHYKTYFEGPFKLVF